MGDLTAAYTESAHLLGNGGHLVGVRTRPTSGPDPALPTVVFLNSGIIHRVGPNRLYVRLARALALQGSLVFRFDFSGIGDSGSPSHDGGMHRSEVEQTELSDVLNWIQGREGVDQFVLIGLCSGGDNAFLGIVRDERVVGAVLLDPFAFRTPGYFLRYYGPRLFNPAVMWRVLAGTSPALKRVPGTLRRIFQSRTSAAEPQSRDLTRPTRNEMRQQLMKVIGRSGRLLYIFTGGLEERYYYRNQFFNAFRGLDFKGLLDFEYYPEADHTFSGQDLQCRLEKRVVGWFQMNFCQNPGSSEAPR